MLVWECRKNITSFIYCLSAPSKLYDRHNICGCSFYILYVYLKSTMNSNMSIRIQRFDQISRLCTIKIQRQELCKVEREWREKKNTSYNKCWHFLGYIIVHNNNDFMTLYRILLCCLLHIGMQYQYHLVEYNTSHLFDKEMLPLQDKYFNIWIIIPK